jgi:hypothetical protein
MDFAGIEGHVPVGSGFVREVEQNGVDIVRDLEARVANEAKAKLLGLRDGSGERKAEEKGTWHGGGAPGR